MEFWIGKDVDSQRSQCVIPGLWASRRKKRSVANKGGVDVILALVGGVHAQLLGSHPNPIGHHGLCIRLIWAH